MIADSKGEDSVEAGRAVSTVLDVGLALLLATAAVAVLVAFSDRTETDHDPMQTEYTTETVATMTINASYAPEQALEQYHEKPLTEIYDSGDLKRVSHGPVGAHAANLAVANVAFAFETIPGKSDRTGQTLTRAAIEYEREVEEMLQSRLAGTRFNTNITAVWEPIEDGPIRGETTLGETPPKYADVSTSTVTVSSDIPAVRAEAIAAVNNSRVYDPVARVVADAIIEGYLPELESQRALESSGIERALVVYRYQNMARILHKNESITPHLKRETANATKANRILRRALANQLENQLQPPSIGGDVGPLGDAHEVAQAVSTGEVTITIRTW